MLSNYHRCYCGWLPSDHKSRVKTILQEHSHKINKKQCSEMGQWVKYMLPKCKDLSLDPSPTPAQSQVIGQDMIPALTSRDMQIQRACWILAFFKPFHKLPRWGHQSILQSHYTITLMPKLDEDTAKNRELHTKFLINSESKILNKILAKQNFRTN